MDKPQPKRRNIKVSEQMKRPPAPPINRPKNFVPMRPHTIMRAGRTYR